MKPEQAREQAVDGGLFTRQSDAQANNSCGICGVCGKFTIFHTVESPHSDRTTELRCGSNE
jgi:hypothetical protein